MRLTRFVLVLTFLMTISGIASPLLAADAPGLSVSVSVSPASTTPEEYLCKAEIIDLETNHVVASPKITFKKGYAGKVVTKDDANNVLVFEVSIDKTGTAISYSVTFSKNEKVVNVQKGSLSIH